MESDDALLRQDPSDRTAGDSTEAAGVVAVLKKPLPPCALFIALPFPALACSLAGYGGGLHWTLDLFSHFKAQYFFVALLCAVAIPTCHAYGRRRRRISGGGDDDPRFPRKAAIAGLSVAIATMVLNAFEIVPLFFSPYGSATADAGKPTRVLFINVNTANKRYGDVERLILDERPDIVVLAEVDAAWLSGIKGVFDAYPFHIASPRGDNFGIALFAERKPLEMKLVPIGDPNYGIQCAMCRFEMDGRRATLLGAHTLPPVGSAGYDERNAMLAEIAEIAAGKKRSGEEVVVVGDLNTTPWSDSFKRLERGGALRDARSGFGVQPTWPAIPFLFPLLIPLDHCLVSEGITVIELEVLRNVGSDHYPLSVSLRGKPSPTASRNPSAVP